LFNFESKGWLIVGMIDPRFPGLSINAMNLESARYTFDLTLQGSHGICIYHVKCTAHERVREVKEG
jgi:hypothetical protein